MHRRSRNDRNGAVQVYSLNRLSENRTTRSFNCRRASEHNRAEEGLSLLPAKPLALRGKNGRSDRIRTYDPLIPNRLLRRISAHHLGAARPAKRLLEALHGKACASSGHHSR